MPQERTARRASASDRTSRPQQAQDDKHDYGSNEQNKAQIPPVGLVTGNPLSWVWDMLEAGDRLVESWKGDGDDASWAHGSRLVSEFADDTAQGPAIRGYADKDINVDLIMALANAKGMKANYSKFSTLENKEGTELLEAIAENMEIIEGGVESIRDLFEEGAEVFEVFQDPETAKKLRAHADTVEQFLKVKASGFSAVDASDGPGAKAAHPDESYVDGLGWVSSKELVVEYGTAKRNGAHYEFVKFADYVALYAIDGVKQARKPQELAFDNNTTFAGGRTVRSQKMSGDHMVWVDEHVPCPAWAKR